MANWDSSILPHVVNQYRWLKWCVIPLDGKRPRGRWKRYQTQRSESAQHKVWWGSGRTPNIGIVTGPVSGLAVVDVDGLEGKESLKQAGITLPDTITVETGGGGWHYYYRYPDSGVKTGTNILPHVDIRAEGGIVAAPPSVHPETGKKYRFAEGKAPNEIELAEFPKELINPMKAAKTQDRALVTVLDGVPEGQRDDKLFRYACFLKSKGLDRPAIEYLVLIAAAKCTPPFPEAEAMAKVESAWKYAGIVVRDFYQPNIISAAELAVMELPETQWVYEGLLPVGLSILAGRPKVGKSWLALLIARSVALGRDFLSFSGPFKAGIAPNLPCSGDVLYLALEDNLRRLQERNTQIGIKGKLIKQEDGTWDLEGENYADPDNLYFEIRWPNMETGCVEQIELFLDEHPDTKLIVIDVMQRVIIRKGRSTVYAEDYDAMRPLQELASRRNIAILGVHHLRKQKSEDPLEAVSGSFGLTAGVDNVFVLQRVKGRLAKLYITGRDIREEQEIAVEHNKDASWTVLGNAEDYFMSDERKAILEVIREKGPITPKEIATELGRNPSTIRSLISSMLKSGLLDKDNDNKYTIMDLPKHTDDMDNMDGINSVS